MKLNVDAHLWCLGTYAERYVPGGYFDPIELDDQLEIMSKIDGLTGLFVFYPTPPMPTDPDNLLKKLADNNLNVSNLAVEGWSDRKWKNGAFSTNEANIRKESAKLLITTGAIPVARTPEENKKFEDAIEMIHKRFGNAMKKLENLGLVKTIKEFSGTGKPVLGICLGMQMLMSKSYEFGEHAGLNLIKGKVIKFENTRENGKLLKAPLVGWHPVEPARSWDNTPLQNIKTPTDFYFAHSYYADVKDLDAKIVYTDYGFNLSASVQKKNIYGTQFHPEKSGQIGLNVLKNFAKICEGKNP